MSPQQKRQANAVPRLTVLRARKMMRDGTNLFTAAAALGVRAADLDVALWNYLGEDI